MPFLPLPHIIRCLQRWRVASAAIDGMPLNYLARAGVDNMQTQILWRYCMMWRLLTARALVRMNNVCVPAYFFCLRCRSEKKCGLDGLYLSIRNQKYAKANTVACGAAVWYNARSRHVCFLWWTTWALQWLLYVKEGGGWHKQDPYQGGSWRNAIVLETMMIWGDGFCLWFVRYLPYDM